VEKCQEYTERLRLRPVTSEDYEYLYNLHVASMKEYVERTWGWDEEFQQKGFRKHFDPADLQIITLDNESVGVVSIRRNATEFFLRAIEIHPEYQRREIGTYIIRSILDEADGEAVPVILYVLKVNPARKLYERLGLRIVGETATHYTMTAHPNETF
jgi:ribosomal protein S18 acetylase RimI-like enzyme